MQLTHNFLLLPEEAVSVADILTDSGKSQDEARKIIETSGFSTLRKSSSGSLSKFILDGMGQVVRTDTDLLDGVDAVIVVSQSFDQRIPSISTRLQATFELPKDVFCIDLFDGCAGFIKALKLISSLEAIGHKKFLVVAGDLNSIMTENAELGTTILFGDGIAATIFEATGEPSRSLLFNSGDIAGTISCGLADNQMLMDGFEVFRFARNVVPGLVSEFLDKTGDELEDFDLVGLHQASKLVVAALSKTLKLRADFSETFNCGGIGNIGAGSIGAWLSNSRDLETRGPLKMLAIGFGSGLSWGASSFTLNIVRNETFHVSS